MTTTVNDDDNANEQDVTIIDDTLAVEDGEIITLVDDDDDETSNKKEVEDGELTESEGSEVCVKFLIFDKVQFIRYLKREKNDMIFIIPTDEIT